MKSGPLTPEELKNYTGYEQPAYQFKWLQKHGINARRRGRDLKVVVTWEQINATPAEAPRAKPNIGAARG